VNGCEEKKSPIHVSLLKKPAERTLSAELLLHALTSTPALSLSLAGTFTLALSSALARTLALAFLIPVLLLLLLLSTGSGRIPDLVAILGTLLRCILSCLIRGGLREAYISQHKTETQQYQY